MRIAYNPKTAQALVSAPDNEDITFDLSGLAIYAKGVKFEGKVYSVFKKHTLNTTGGYDGLVPAPSYTETITRYLREDGTWVVPTNTTYTFASGTTGDFTVTPSGGTAQTVNIGKPATAGNADTVDGYSLSMFGPYKDARIVTDTTNSTWYVKVELNLAWNLEPHSLFFKPSYNNIAGHVTLEIPTYNDENGYIIKTSSYNRCNITGIRYIYNHEKELVYLRLKGYTSASCVIYATCTINSALVISNPNIDFMDVYSPAIQTNYSIYAPKLHGTAEKADKLSTPRKIWGQSFDGSGDVSGSALFDTFIDINDAGTGNRLTSYIYQGIGRIYNYNETTKTFGDLWLGNNSGNIVNIKSNGNVGIGTTDPQYPLHVIGNTEINANGNGNSPLIINTPSMGHSGFVHFKAEGATIGKIGFFNYIPTIQDKNNNRTTILHTGNLSTYFTNGFEHVGETIKISTSYITEKIKGDGLVVDDKGLSVDTSNFTTKTVRTLPIGKVARIEIKYNSNYLIALRGTNTGRGALVYVTGYGSGGTMDRQTLRVIYSSEKYEYYFNGASDKVGSVYVKNNNTSTDDTVSVVSLDDHHALVVEILDALPSDATRADYDATRLAVQSDIPTKVSQLTNDSGFLTSRGYIGTTVVQSSSATQNLTGIGSINMAGDIIVVSNGDTGIRLIRLTGGSNDFGRIAVGATDKNAGWMEIATADDATEPIYVRLYSGTYEILKRTLTLLDSSGDTSIPNNLSVGNDLTVNRYLSFGYAGYLFTTDIRSSWRSSVFGNTTQGSRFRTLRTDYTLDKFSEIHGSGITWAAADTHGYLSTTYSSKKAFIGGGSGDSLNWTAELIHSSNIGSQSVNYANSSGYASSAGNADKLDNLHSYAFKKTWEAHAGKTYVGWVTIATWTVSTAGHFSPNPFMLSIYRSYNSPASESYTFSITFGWNTATITQVSGNAKDRIIEKLRIGKCSDNLTYKLEMYVNTAYTTYDNTCYCVAYGYCDYNFSATTTCALTSNVSSTLAEISTSSGNIVGNLVGNASIASKLGSSTLGGTYQPIYLSSGTATAGTSYAKAIKSITRSGTTFTYTCIDGTTGTFTLLDNNSTYAVYGKTINASYKTAYRTLTKGNTTNGYYISAIRCDTASVSEAPLYGSGLAFGNSDTHGYLYTDYNSSNAYIGGGNADKLNWTATLLHSGNSSVSKSGQTLTVKINGVELSLTNTTYSSLKNPNAIKFKKTDGTTVTYDGSSAADLTGGVNFAKQSDIVTGSYTSNGGQQNPNYFGKNKVGFLMMNTSVNNNSLCKDWIIMDCYHGNDVGGGVAFGVNRQALGAYIMRSEAARTAWTESAELLGTHNYTQYTVKKDGTGASGTWGIDISGTAANAISAVALALKAFNTASQITTSYAQWVNNAGCTDVPSMSYASVLNVGYGNYRWWQIWNSRNDHQLYWRPEKADASDWADVHTLIDDKNIDNYLPTVTNYYWADLKITSTSSSTTTPTVSSITATSLFYLKSNDATLKIYPIAGLEANLYGYEAVAIQTAFDGTDPSSTDYTTKYPHRTVLSLQPRGGSVGIGTTAPENYLHVNGDVLIKNSSGNRILSLTSLSSSLRLFACEDATYIESGNSDFSENKPLKVTGIGGNTGSDLYLVFSNIYTRGGKYINIDSGNIGSQSVNYATSAGNADTVDSKHASDFEAYKCTVIDTTGLNENTWYPVTFEIGCSLQTRIRVEGRTNTTGSWNNRSDKTMAVLLDYVVQGSNWGWISPTRIVYDFELGAGAGGTNCVAGLGLLTNSSTEYVYVRGGAKYNFYISRFITPVLRTTSYTVSGQTIAPTTTSPTAITINNALKSDLTWSNVSGKPSFATVATSGSYNDLSNRPTIGNGTVTITQGGTTKGSFTMNQSGNTTIALTDNNTDTNTWYGDGLWAPSTNITLQASSNSQEWSFDIYRNSKTGCYWHVWDSSLNTMLKVNADDGKVSAPYGFVGNLTGTASHASKLNLVSCYNGTTNNDLWSTIKSSNSSYLGTATIYEVYNDGGPSTYGHVLDIVTVHYNHWQSQLWFDAGKGGRLRYRNKDYNNDTWGNWFAVAFTSDIPSSLPANGGNADTLDDLHASDFMRHRGWWDGNKSYSADGIATGMYFAYPNHGVPNSWGTLVTFAYLENASYNLQLHGTGNNYLYYRNRSADYGQKPWKRLADADELKNPANYYWANVKVSASSSTSTNPTFASASVTDRINVTNYVFLNPSGSGIYLDTNSLNWHTNSGHQRFLLRFTSDGNVGIGITPSYKLDVDGSAAAKIIYANKAGSNTDGGISLYSSSDPMTYGIAFRGTGTYGTHGSVTSDWATYFTMNNQTDRGWIFRRYSTNVCSISGGGNVRAEGSVTAKGFIHYDYWSSAYALTSNGGVAHIGSMSVNYANSAGNTDTVDGYHISVVTSLPSTKVNNTIYILV